MARKGRHPTELKATVATALLLTQLLVPPDANSCRAFRNAAARASAASSRLLFDRPAGRSAAASSLSSFSALAVTGFGYGRGAEIWPECNEDAVKLSSSFPNGKIPYSAALILDETARAETPATVVQETEQGEQSAQKTTFARRIIRTILRRAAAREELDSETQAPGLSIDRAPSMLALGLIVKGLVQPLDIMLVSFFTAYFVMLSMVAQSPRESTGVPMLAALPPQGHVPTIVSAPLGESFSNSSGYNRWIKLGLLIGIFAPLGLVAKHILHNETELARACGRPLFLLCFQAISEAYSRRVMSPLPIRILIPLAYNAVRLFYLWQWSTTKLALGVIGRSLAIGNAAYWSLNMFAFLIPVASVRYMRAHFFGVEAQEVKLRTGLEETIGLIPR